MNIWLKAAIVSAVIAFVLVIYQIMFHMQAVGYAPGVAASELEQLKYFDAVKLLQSRAQAPARGFSVFLDEAGDWWLWQQLLIAWVNTASMCFFACALLILWNRSWLHPRDSGAQLDKHLRQSPESSVASDV